MSTLHTISKPPASTLLKSCLSIVQAGDAILLIEDGVYYIQQPGIILANSDIEVYCLREDLTARGLNDRKPDKIENVNIHGFVELTAHYENTINWF